MSLKYKTKFCRGLCVCPTEMLYLLIPIPTNQFRTFNSIITLLIHFAFVFFSLIAKFGKKMKVNASAKEQQQQNKKWLLQPDF